MKAINEVLIAFRQVMTEAMLALPGDLVERGHEPGPVRVGEWPFETVAQSRGLLGHVWPSSARIGNGDDHLVITAEVITAVFGRIDDTAPITSPEPLLTLVEAWGSVQAAIELAHERRGQQTNPFTPFRPLNLNGGWNLDHGAYRNIDGASIIGTSWTVEFYAESALGPALKATGS